MIQKTKFRFNQFFFFRRNIDSTDWLFVWQIVLHHSESFFVRLILQNFGLATEKKQRNVDWKRALPISSQTNATFGPVTGPGLIPDEEQSSAKLKAIITLCCTWISSCCCGPSRFFFHSPAGKESIDPTTRLADDNDDRFAGLSTGSNWRNALQSLI